MTREPQRLGNVAAEISSFVGRRNELAALRSKLASSRLISLVGTGGVGKTRLAGRAAADLGRGFADGAWLVELADVPDPALVPNAVATALTLQDQAPGGTVSLLVSFLADKELLLVLDNCEHVLDAAAQLATQLLRSAPQLRIIATSREPLAAPGEQVLPVPPLELPAEADDSSLALLSGNEAVSLFMERAAAASGAFVLSDDNRSAVIGICRRLDGLPLAVELAAVRTRVLSVEQILAHLDDRFTLLTAGSRVALPRHQTLRTAMDWSYELLSDELQSVLRRLSIFAGRFTWDDAEALCAGVAGAAPVVEILASLVDKSLLLKEDVGSLASYRMHETTRDYAAEKLADAGETDTTQRAFSDYYLARCWDAAEGARFQLVEWLSWIDLEIDNLRAILFRFWSEGSRDQGLQLLGSLVWYWVTRATTEGRRWLDLFLDVESEHTITTPDAHFLRGFLAVLQADPITGSRELMRAVVARRPEGALRALAENVAMASVAANMAGDRENGQGLCDEAHLLADELDDVEARLASLQAVAMNGFFTADLATYRSASAQAEALSRAANDLYSLEIWLMNQGFAAMLIGDEDPTPYLKQALEIAEQIDDRVAQLYLVAALGVQAAATDQSERAVQLFGAAERIRTQTGAQINPILAPLLQQHTESLRAQLGVAAFEDGQTAGASLGRAEAIRLALGATQPRQPPSDSSTLAPLARRETEVARLIGQGLSNRQIGSRLFISERTVENHVRNIMNKLGFTARTQIAAWISAASS